jgi:pimeloyl-ACP methyl ester carboxylesterase
LKLPPQQKAMMAGNMATLKAYGGNTIDPSLRGRLSALAVPTLVVWGESDRIMDPEYGRAYAQAITGAQFRLLPGAGHVPQIEAPEALAEAIWPFVSRL